MSNPIMNILENTFWKKNRLIQVFRENTNVLYQNITGTRRLYELLMPSLK